MVLTTMPLNHLGSFKNMQISRFHHNISLVGFGDLALESSGDSNVEAQLRTTVSEQGER